MCLNVCTVTRALEKILPSCVKCIASGPFTTHQFSATSVQLFQRSGKGCTHVHVRSFTCTPHLASVKRLANGNLCKTLILWVFNSIPNFSAIPVAFSEIRKGGAHVCTCSHTPPYTFVKCLADVSLTTHKIPVRSVRPFPRYGKISAPAHVRTCRCTPS